MNINELRLVNWVSSKCHGGLHTEIFSILSHDKVKLGANPLAIYTAEDIEGIPLTPEWLLRFGFENVYESKFRIKYDYMKDFRFGYDVNKALKNTPEGVSFRGDHYTNVKHVHQLQNLFFAITGEELTLKTE